MCSQKCHWAWTEKNGRSHRASVGSIREHTSGHMVVKMEDGSWAWQHRLIVEAHLERKLESKEVIHHIDGDKTNNAIDNLVVCNQSEHMKIHREAEKIGMKIQSGNFFIVPRHAEICDETEAW